MVRKIKKEHTDEELKKEMGNIIFSTIRWCDDLGYDPEECINLARKAQKDFSRIRDDMGLIKEDIGLIKKKLKA